MRATAYRFESGHRHHVGAHSARLGKGRRESACLFLICALWLLLPKSDPLRWAPIWILESGHPTGCPLSDAAPSVRFYPLRSIKWEGGAAPPPKPSPKVGGKEETGGSFLMPHLRCGFIRFAQLNGRGRCAPSQALPKGWRGGENGSLFLVPHLRRGFDPLRSN